MASMRLSLVALVTFLASCVLAVIPLEVKGADFVNSISGERFQIIGVAYQPGGAAGFDPGSGRDPLSDADVCMRDAIMIQRLGANTIRVYNLDPDLDHSQCAAIFNAAGIYMILDVNSPLPNESLNRIAPWESYNTDYITRVFKVIDSFKGYNNTLGFFSANEIINEQSVAEVPQYVRAVTRDIKDYISKHASRTIPVGYSAADVRPLLTDTYNYFSCGLDNETSSKIDFFGLNSYSWCGSSSSYTESGYDVLVADFSNTTIPIFFSEYGCIEPAPRVFDEVLALYSSPMTGVFSGGIVYEYSEEPNNYGLVVINDNNTISEKSDYGSFMSQASKIDLGALTAANSTATGLTPPTCESSMIRSNLTNSFDVPARPDGFDDLIDNGVPGVSSNPSSISDTAEKSKVYDSNGNEVTGLRLNLLANDQSNLPGNNTSGTSGTTTNGGSSSSTPSNAAVKVGNVNMAMAAGAVAFGLFAQL